MEEEPQRGWFRSVVRPLLPLLQEIFSASLFVNLLALATPVFVLQVYDRVVSQAGLTTLQGLVIGMGVVVLFDFVLRQARSALLQEAAMTIDAEIGQRLFDKFLGLPLRSLERRPAAFWQAAFRDVDHVRSTLSGAFAVLVADVPFALFGALLVILIAAPVAWVLAVTIPLFLILAWRSGSTMRSSGHEERRATIRRDALIAELIAGRTTAKSLGVRKFMRTLWEERQAETIDSAVTRARRADRYHNLGHALQILTTVAMTGVGALAILEQQLTVGALIAANMLAGRILAPLNQLIYQWKAYTVFRQAISRLDQIFSMPEDLQERALELARPQGRMTLDAATFRYQSDDQNNVINGVRAQLGPASMRAVVGNNGSGKSTLLKLLRGLYQPMSGRILLDGGDLAQFSEDELLAWIGYLPQECRLFTGSIKNNILIGSPEAEDAAVTKAATLAGVHAQILDSPKGYRTQVGESGGALSGGMRQRITIARAFLGDPPVILLDEPTSNLDRQAEVDLANTLKKLSADHTVVVVTHSPALLELCDNILVLDQGRITGGGPAKEVLPRVPAAAKEVKKAEPEKPQTVSSRAAASRRKERKTQP